MGIKRAFSIIVALSLLLSASIAPGMAWAGRRGSQVTLSPPYEDASVLSTQFCGSFSSADPEGDARCYDLASSADANTGQVTGTAKTSTESPADPTGLTASGKALANSRGTIDFDFPIRGSASSVTFTVLTDIHANASANGLNVCGFVFLTVRAWSRGAFSQGVEEFHQTSACNVGSASTDESKTFSLNLSPPDRMKGFVRLSVDLVAGAQIGFPEFVGSGVSTSNADVTVKGVTAEIAR